MSLFSNCFGTFSFRNTAIVGVIAGLFSWFVLHNTDATVFFGIASLVSLLVYTNQKRSNDRFDEVYRQIDENHRSNAHDHEAVYRYIDDRVEECMNKSKR